MEMKVMCGRIWVGVCFLGLLVGGLAVGSWLGGQGALAVDLQAVLAGPSALHWLGCDELGRDVLARLAEGVRVSLTVGVVVLGITAAIGVPLGLLAGWFGGRVDRLVLRLTEVVLSFPGILLALAFAALAGGGMAMVMLVLGLLGWVGFARLARVQVLALREAPFVAAAKLSGVRTGGIFLRHLLPNCAPPLVVEALLVLSGSMVAEAGLSFLGLGIPAPMPSLGGMLRDGMKVVLVAPHLVVLPALVLIGLTVSVNLVAEGLRKRLAGGNEMGR